MPISRSLLLTVPVSLAAAALVVPLHRTAASPAPGRSPSDSAPATAGIEVEVKCVDDSTLKVKLLDDKLEMLTKYGPLQILLADVRRVEFAQRCPPEVAEKIALAISKLGHSDFQTRERATAELKSYRERAYPFLQRAVKSDDPEVSRRADEAAKAIHAAVPAAVLQPRENDVVYTEDSKFTGKLTAQSVRVLTVMFGEQQLKLADMRSLRSGTALAADEFPNAAPAPSTLINFQNQFGKELVFTLTGHTPGNGQQASVWGTDLYSLDSNLAAAAVHAGVARPGETTSVRVRIVQSPPQYLASLRNGVNSIAYGNFPSGAFEFVRR